MEPTIFKPPLKFFKFGLRIKFYWYRCKSSTAIFHFDFNTNIRQRKPQIGPTLTSQLSGAFKSPPVFKDDIP